MVVFVKAQCVLYYSSTTHLHNINFIFKVCYMQVGKTIQIAATQSNLKRVTLELGGKSPNIVFDDCDRKLLSY